MNKVKILEQLTHNTFVIELTPSHRTKSFAVHHDFVEFNGYDYLRTKDNIHINRGNIKSNVIAIDCGIQISIRMFFKQVLPYLIKHEYLQEEHFKDRIDNNGKSYVSYSYHKHQALEFYDNINKEFKVAVLDEGDSNLSIVTKQFYDKYIYPSINK